jgi:Flp pilus assembly protein TadB
MLITTAVIGVVALTSSIIRSNQLKKKREETQRQISQIKLANKYIEEKSRQQYLEGKLKRIEEEQKLYLYLSLLIVSIFFMVIVIVKGKRNKH